MKTIKACSCVVVLLAAMAACGGGGCNPCEAEPMAQAPKADCVAKPEGCT